MPKFLPDDDGEFFDIREPIPPINGFNLPNVTPLFPQAFVVVTPSRVEPKVCDHHKVPGQRDLALHQQTLHDFREDHVAIRPRGHLDENAVTYQEVGLQVTPLASVSWNGYERARVRDCFVRQSSPENLLQQPL